MVDWNGTTIDGDITVVKASVSAVVMDGERILLQHRSDNGLWGIPGGAVEAGESVSAALQREVREEAGVGVEIIRIVGVYSDPENFSLAYYASSGDIVQYVNICFLCSPESSVVCGSSEGRVQFFDKHRLPGPILRAHQVRIEDALSGGENVLIK